MFQMNDQLLESAALHPGEGSQVPQNQRNPVTGWTIGRGEKKLTIVGNQSKIPKSYIPYPDCYNNAAISAVYASVEV